MGVGIIYWPPVLCAWEWFGNKKGLATGLIIGAFGFGSFVFSFITSAIVNPNNLPLYKLDENTNVFPLLVAEKVPNMLKVVAILFFILMLTGIYLVERNPLFALKEKELNDKRKATG